MKKNLTYQRPSLNGLNNDASGLCTMGTSATGQIYFETNCFPTGGAATPGWSFDVGCDTGYSDSDGGTISCVAGPSVTTNLSACDAGQGVS